MQNAISGQKFELRALHASCLDFFSFLQVAWIFSFFCTLRGFFLFFLQVAWIFSFFASCLDFFFFLQVAWIFSFFASCLYISFFCKLPGFLLFLQVAWLFSLFCKLPEWEMCPLGFYITTNWVRRRCGLESGGNLSTFIFYHFRNLSPCISKKLPSLLWKVTKNTYFV